MRKLTTVFLVFCISLSAFGQNGLKGGRYFLLPKDKKTISVNTFENNKIKEIKTYPITEKSLFTTDQKRKVAILDTADNSISLYDIETSTELKLSIPFKLKPKTILLNENNLFIGGFIIGGKMNNEILIQYHIQNDKWYLLEIPEEVKKFEKAIDDLLVNDTLLIAIDNEIHPKYILYYHLNSKTFGRSGVSLHITLYDDLDLTKSFAVSSTTFKWSETFYTFNDFLLIENNLFIANSEKGLGLFEIKDSYFQGKDKNKYFDFNASISEDKIIYKQYKNNTTHKNTQ
jgi:hypothetical protein